LLIRNIFFHSPIFFPFEKIVNNAIQNIFLFLLFVSDNIVAY